MVITTGCHHFWSFQWMQLENMYVYELLYTPIIITVYLYVYILIYNFKWLPTDIPTIIQLHKVHSSLTRLLIVNCFLTVRNLIPIT